MEVEGPSVVPLESHPLKRKNGTRIIYQKEFLVDCFRNPVCKKKPKTLPEHLEITLDAPRINGTDPCPPYVPPIPWRPPFGGQHRYPNDRHAQMHYRPNQPAPPHGQDQHRGRAGRSYDGYGSRGEEGRDFPKGRNTYSGHRPQGNYVLQNKGSSNHGNYKTPDDEESQPPEELQPSGCLPLNTGGNYNPVQTETSYGSVQDFIRQAELDLCPTQGNSSRHSQQGYYPAIVELQLQEPASSELDFRRLYNRGNRNEFTSGGPPEMSNYNHNAFGAVTANPASSSTSEQELARQLGDNLRSMLSIGNGTAGKSEASAPNTAPRAGSSSTMASGDDDQQSFQKIMDELVMKGTKKVFESKQTLGMLFGISS